MKQRLKKIDRIIKVQQHLHKNAELHLANLQRKESELKVAQEEILETMGDADVLHGLFVDVIANRLKRLALEEDRVHASIVTQKIVTTENALKVKRSEKLLSRLKEEARQGQEKKDLIAILEAVVQKDRTSLP
ncbi:hypothetical protein [Microvirga pakistanensis]|uniref:hypothetical protein n=1 Tax=Microvirga pakistanensis TaxID=1682650 RepID=UPI00106917DF|nr:hypothetical protein [Microvirga pakistanensis]